MMESHILLLLWVKGEENNMRQGQMMKKEEKMGSSKDGPQKYKLNEEWGERRRKKRGRKVGDEDEEEVEMEAEDRWWNQMII